jgi:DNA-binding transcriptional regulator YhcF (GntR family)
MKKIVDLSNEPIGFSIDEAASEVDGKHILGKIKGEFFCPDGYSRNQRFYPRSLWEKTLKNEDVKSKLSDRVMFGSISHDTPLNDESFRDGKFSHIVTKLFIDEDGKGIGEALILNTPTGRILNTVARAGSKMFVSTRADGQFNGETSEGTPIVDSDSYKLHTVDFVLRPGFLDANPTIAEQWHNLNSDIDKENTMSKELLEKLTDENGNLKADLSKMTDKYEAVKVENQDNQSENETLKVEVDRLTECEKELTTYKELGTVEELTEAKEAKTEMAKYDEELGTFEDINKALDLASEKLNDYKELGTIEEIKTVLEDYETTKTWLTELGTQEEVEQTIEIAENVIKEREAIKIKEAIQELATELKVPFKAVEKVYNTLSVEDIKELFAGLTEMEKEDDKEDDKKDDEEKEEKDESLTDDSKDEAEVEEKVAPTKSRCANLMEKLV